MKSYNEHIIHLGTYTYIYIQKLQRRSSPLAWSWFAPAPFTVDLRWLWMGGNSG